MIARNASRRAGRAVLGTLLLGTALLAAPAGAQVSVGDVPAYTFEQPLQNGLGAGSLEDLRGKLVWVEFWGTY